MCVWPGDGRPWTGWVIYTVRDQIFTQISGDNEILIELSIQTACGREIFIQHKDIGDLYLHVGCTIGSIMYTSVAIYNTSPT